MTHLSPVYNILICINLSRTGTRIIFWQYCWPLIVFLIIRARSWFDSLHGMVGTYFYGASQSCLFCKKSTPLVSKVVLTTGLWCSPKIILSWCKYKLAIQCLGWNNGAWGWGRWPCNHHYLLSQPVSWLYNPKGAASAALKLQLIV